MTYTETDDRTAIFGLAKLFRVLLDIQSSKFSVAIEKILHQIFKGSIMNKQVIQNCPASLFQGRVIE